MNKLIFKLKHKEKKNPLEKNLYIQCVLKQQLKKDRLII